MAGRWRGLCAAAVDPDAALFVEMQDDLGVARGAEAVLRAQRLAQGRQVVDLPIDVDDLRAILATDRLVAATVAHDGTGRNRGARASRRHASISSLPRHTASRLGDRTASLPPALPHSIRRRTSARLRPGRRLRRSVPLSVPFWEADATAAVASATMGRHLHHPAASPRPLRLRGAGRRRRRIPPGVHGAQLDEEAQR